ncbi:S-adenosylmethionine decarboxylase proenzyme [Mycobacterium sp. E3298]|nr:S-adenosylmethionine decarboxylase proenzyme [Mycobacterium sp. E3298]
MWGVDAGTLDNIDMLRDLSREALEKANATILGHIEKHFIPNGVTIMFLLQESSYDIHTYPSQGFASFDVYTCGDTAMPQVAAQHLIDCLKPDPTRVYWREIIRGVE